MRSAASTLLAAVAVVLLWWLLTEDESAHVPSPVPNLVERTPATYENRNTDQTPVAEQVPRVQDPGAKLRDTVWVTGRVTAEDGSAIAGASIVCHESPAAALFRTLRGSYRQNETNSDSGGNFEVEAWRQCDHEIAVTAEGYATVRMGSVRCGEELAIVMFPGVDVQGRVVIGEDRQPVAGIQVRLSGSEGTRFRGTVHSANDGTFRFRGVGPGRHLLTTELYWKGWGAAFELMEVEDDPVYVELALRDGFRASGRVVDVETRQRIAGAVITINDERNVVATCDASGEFAVEGLPKRFAFRLTASAEGYASTQQSALLPKDATEVRIEFKLGRPLSVWGWVSDGRASPVSDARVAVVSRCNSPYPNVPWEQVRTTLTAADGRFRIEGIAPGAFDYSLWISARGSELFEQPIRFESPDLDLGEVRIQPESVLRGKVISSVGTPLPALEVRLRREARAGNRGHWAPMRTESADDGTFTFGSLARGSYQVTAYQGENKYGSQPVRIDESGETYSVVINRDAAPLGIAGSVVGVDGTAAVGAKITCISDPPSLKRSTTSDPKGHFTFPRLPDAVFEVVAHDAEGLSATRRADLRRGDSDVTLQLVPLERVHGSVIDKRGMPVVAAYLLLIPSDWKSLQATSTDESGEFHFDVEESTPTCTVVAWRSKVAFQDALRTGAMDSRKHIIDPDAPRVTWRGGESVGAVVLEH